jgi:hypothetical protein
VGASNPLSVAALPALVALVLPPPPLPPPGFPAPTGPTLPLEPVPLSPLITPVQLHSANSAPHSAEARGGRASRSPRCVVEAETRLAPRRDESFGIAFTFG